VELWDVKLVTFFCELARLFLKANFKRSFPANAMPSSKLANILGYFHAAKMRSTHGTEVSGLRAFGGKRFVVKLARGLGIEREIELIFPSELEARFADGVVSVLRAGMAFG
jgi:hypothetical protein